MDNFFASQKISNIGNSCQYKTLSIIQLSIALYSQKSPGLIGAFRLGHLPRPKIS
jgi:hypothetical protein